MLARWNKFYKYVKKWGQISINSFCRKKLQKNTIILHFYIPTMNTNLKTFLKHTFLFGLKTKWPLQKHYHWMKECNDYYTQEQSNLSYSSCTDDSRKCMNTEKPAFPSPESVQSLRTTVHQPKKPEKMMLSFSK